MRRAFLLALCVVLAPASLAIAQVPVDAHWIWYDDGNPAESAASGKVWFRIESRAGEPSTGAVRIACDDAFTLWVNGQKIGSGGGNESFRFNLNGIVDRGTNVIAIEAENKNGRAGLIVDGEIRSQGGNSMPFDSSSQWLATREAPASDAWLAPDFDVSTWRPAKDLGPHDVSPWKEIKFPENYLDRYVVPPGWTIERIGEPELVGSLVAMTWGYRGRLLVSRERGPIVSLIDDNEDGTFDKAVEFSNQMSNCQGLCMVGEILFAVGDGPQGAGMYKLPNRDGDDVADSVELVTNYKGGMGEHGPHDVVLGPDGWLYHNSGNHAWITHQPEPTSAIREYYEGDLLKPRFEDPNGHAAGIPAPGGTVWRFTPDGKKWFLNTMGFRNHYDVAFNSDGDLFTFDSDMEWEVGMPFYKPVRVTHCTQGADFGWRSNAGKWLPYFYDSLPSAVDVGRGSPTGIVMYEHQLAPRMLIVSDWSMGRILGVELDPAGASYHGKFSTLVSGNPLNVSDVEVDRDGSIIFTTGGRGTEGGVFRVRPPVQGDAPKKAVANSIEDVLTLPQSSSGWAREDFLRVRKQVGNNGWEASLLEAAETGKPEIKIRALTLLAQLGPPAPTRVLLDLAHDKSPKVRSFVALLLGDRKSTDVAGTLGELLQDKDPAVVRRACESLVRSGSVGPVEPLVKLLGNPDRFLRYHARLALERVPVEQWKELVLRNADAAVVAEGLLALYRLGPKALASQAGVDRASEIVMQETKNPLARLNALRAVQLFLVPEDSHASSELAKNLLDNLSDGNADQGDPTALGIVMESARLLSFLQTPGAAQAIIGLLQKTQDRNLQIHLVHVSSYLQTDWDYETNVALLNWLESTQRWEGGHSFSGWIRNFMLSHLQHITPADRGKLLLDGASRPYATQFLLANSDSQSIADFQSVVTKLLDAADAKENDPAQQTLLSAVIEALGKSEDNSSKELLRKLYQDHADQREQLVRVLAAHPQNEDWEPLVQSLQFGDSATMQISLASLGKLARKPEKADEFRSAILAGLRLGNQGGLAAVQLLQAWTGTPHNKGLDVAAALDFYKSWYSEKYPEAPAAELPVVNVNQTKYSTEQLTSIVDQAFSKQSGDVARGEKIFTKVNCYKCHRFGTKGEGVGPDLTNVRKRFQRKEIIESLLTPSQVISDQYRSLSVETEQGQVFNGLPIKQESKEFVVLLLSDATKIQIKTKDISASEASKISVMPEGLLKELSPEEIADLFAFIETSKTAQAPPAK